MFGFQRDFPACCERAENADCDNNRDQKLHSAFLQPSSAGLDSLFVMNSKFSHVIHTLTSVITNIICHIKGKNIQVMEVDIDRENTRGVHQRANAILTLRLPNRQSHTLVLAELTGLSCICAIEEI